MQTEAMNVRALNVVLFAILGGDESKVEAARAMYAALDAAEKAGFTDGEIEGYDQGFSHGYADGSEDGYGNAVDVFVSNKQPRPKYSHPMLEDHAPCAPEPELARVVQWLDASPSDPGDEDPEPFVGDVGFGS